MAITDKDGEYLIWRVEALVHGRMTIAGGPEKGAPVQVVVMLQDLKNELNIIKAKTDKLP